MKTFAIANQKGGVGKSTFAVHAAFYFAEQGASVLFVDTDGQGNSSGTLSERALPGYDAIDLFESGQGRALAPQPGRITLIRGTSALNEVERLDTEVVAYPRAKIAPLQFDYCIIDTPPTLGLRLIAALVVADYVICPVDLGGYAIDGIVEMIQLIEQIRSNPELNPGLEFLGMVPNHVNSRATKHREAVRSMYANFADYIIKQPLVERITVQDATESGRPVWEIKRSDAQVAGREWRSAMRIIEQRSNGGGAA